MVSPYLLNYMFIGFLFCVCSISLFLNVYCSFSFFITHTQYQPLSFCPLPARQRATAESTVATQRHIDDVRQRDDAIAAMRREAAALGDERAAAETRAGHALATLSTEQVSVGVCIFLLLCVCEWGVGTSNSTSSNPNQSDFFWSGAFDSVPFIQPFHFLSTPSPDSS
jgi:hypothetical protein